MIDFDTFTKIAWECGRFGQIYCCHRLWKVAQSAINCPIWSHCRRLKVVIFGKLWKDNYLEPPSHFFTAKKPKNQKVLIEPSIILKINKPFLTLWPLTNVSLLFVPMLRIMIYCFVKDFVLEDSNVCRFWKVYWLTCWDSKRHSYWVKPRSAWHEGNKWSFSHFY